MLACSENRESLQLAPADAVRVRYRFVRRKWVLIFSVIDAIGGALFKLRRLLAGRETCSATAEPQSILLVQLDHLGDAVLSTGLLSALRMRFPRARIEVLAAPWNREVFAACSEVQRVFVCRNNRFAHVVDWRWPLAFVYWAWRLRRRRYDLGIDVRGDFPHAALLWMAGVRRRLGRAAGGGRFLLTDSADYYRNQHETESRAALLNLLQSEGADATPSVTPRFKPSVAARESASSLLGGLNEFGAGPLLLFHVGAGTQAKCWPVQHWQELIGRLLLLRGDVRMVLVGGIQDVERARLITGGLDWPNLVDWTGQLSVPELAAAAERAAVFVGADSGPAHLAASVGTPVVVVFSSANDPHVWKPIGPQVTVLQQTVACGPCYSRVCPLADHPCMRGLAPERVARAVLKSIELTPELDGRQTRLSSSREVVPAA